MKKTRETLFKVRIKGGSRSTLWQLLQLLGLLAIFGLLMGALFAWQIYDCHKSAPGAPAQECFSGVAKAKARHAKEDK